MNRVIFVRFLAFCVGFGVFAALQLFLWFTSDRGLLGALFFHPWLWLVYFLPALLIAEHVFNAVKRNLGSGVDR